MQEILISELTSTEVLKTFIVPFLGFIAGYIVSRAVKLFASLSLIALVIIAIDRAFDIFSINLNLPIIHGDIPFSDAAIFLLGFIIGIFANWRR
mgnify:CR=1 FL=1